MCSPYFRLMIRLLIASRSGPSAVEKGLAETAAESFHVEYGNLTICVEVVNSVEEAIDHINRYGRYEVILFDENTFMM